MRRTREWNSASEPESQEHGGYVVGQAQRIFYDDTQFEELSNVRYLGVELEDALASSEAVEI